MKTPGGISKGEPIFKPSTLNKKNHTEDLHYIGEGLPIPSQIKNVGVASVGISPIAAREDHVHGPIPPTPPTLTLFTATGTWTKPAGLLYAIVEGQAPGGGSGGSAATGASQIAVSGGGGGGGYCRKLILAAALGATETVTIGAVGTAGAAGANGGGAGGNVTFGAHFTANGGAGGGAGSAATAPQMGGNAGNGGNATGGDLNIPGGEGVSMPGFLLRTCRSPGGTSHFAGMNDSNGNNTGAGGVAGKNYGGGASGSFNCDNQVTTRAGAAGGPGICLVWEFYE